MRLATLAEYARLVYAPGSAPTLKTLRLRIKDIPGGRVELGRYYVDLDANDRVNEIAKANNARIAELRKDPRLKGLV
jgi:hypothetical protein